MLCGVDRNPWTKEVELGAAAPGCGSDMANSLMDFKTIYESLQHLPWISVIEQSPLPIHVPI